jgi:hypothetical protein
LRYEFKPPKYSADYPRQIPFALHMRESFSERSQYYGRNTNNNHVFSLEKKHDYEGGSALNCGKKKAERAAFALVAPARRKVEPWPNYGVPSNLIEWGTGRQLCTGMMTPRNSGFWPRN